MKAIILAAGCGKRMMPLTAKKPKPLLEVNGQPIIDYVLASLPNNIDEIIIVVKYLGYQIKKHVGKKYGDIKVRYVTGSSKGNYYSFLATRKYLKNETFLLIYGDEVPNPVNVEKCIKEGLSILTFKLGIYWEKDGIMVLNTDIFDYPNPEDSNFSTVLDWYIDDQCISLIKAKDFIGNLNTPKDLERVNQKWLKYLS